MERNSEAAMVDIETLGTEPGSIILSIGAVKFGPDGLGEEFYRSINLESCQQVGLRVDADTLNWWLSQDDEVQEVLTGGIDLDTALEEFNAFYKGSGQIWANSPSFDCVILKTAYDAVGIEEAWGYDEERDFRTLRDLPGDVWVDREGDHHDALDDAKHQARKAYQTLNRLEEAFEDE